jgi:hypothetical protein
MIDATGKLLIFENFRTDRNLPKFAVPTEDGGLFNGGTINWATNGVRLTTDDNQSTEDWMRTPRVSRGSRGWVAKLAEWFSAKKPSMSILEFFSSVQNSAEELEVVASRAAGYEAALRHAKDSGQTALREQMEELLIAVRAEAQLAALGLGKYISEETLVRFYKECPKGLRLDWVGNFGRPIPPEVIQVKLGADKRGVFDNYVVLHYDPKGKSYKETKAETAARKDPILFGVISGRRRLYFVGDWKDEFCDLTWDQIAEAVGAASLGDVKKETVV